MFNAWIRALAQCEREGTAAVLITLVETMLAEATHNDSAHTGERLCTTPGSTP